MEEILTVVEHDDLARYLIKVAHERLHLILLLQIPFFHDPNPLFYSRIFFILIRFAVTLLYFCSAYGKVFRFAVIFVT